MQNFTLNFGHVRPYQPEFPEGMATLVYGHRNDLMRSDSLKLGDIKR